MRLEYDALFVLSWQLTAADTLDEHNCAVELELHVLRLLDDERVLRTARNARVPFPLPDKEVELLHRLAIGSARLLGDGGSGEE